MVLDNKYCMSSHIYKGGGTYILWQFCPLLWHKTCGGLCTIVNISGVIQAFINNVLHTKRTVRFALCIMWYFALKSAVVTTVLFYVSTCAVWYFARKSAETGSQGRRSVTAERSSILLSTPVFYFVD